MLTDIQAPALVVFAANSGLSPGHDVLSDTLACQKPDMHVTLAGQLRCWQGLAHQDALRLWIGYLCMEDIVQDAVPLDVQTAQAEVPVHESMPSRLGLRDIVKTAPVEFQCTLDGGLLVDPVRTPMGHVFERSILARSLAQSGGLCPVTGAALALEQCCRDHDLRLRIVKWVRAHQPRNQS